MKVITNDENYTNIANAIREKTGKADKLLPSQMASEINNITTGGGDVEPPLDGKTRLYITLYTTLKTDYVLNIYQNTANGAIIDWGDGSPTETNESTGYVSFNHKYTKSGDFIISIENVGSNQLRLGKNTSSDGILGYLYGENAIYTLLLKKAIIGSSVYLTTNYCFSVARALGKITIDEGIMEIGNGTFNYCESLTEMTIPATVTSIGTQAFAYCQSLKKLHMKSIEPPRLSASNVFTATPKDLIIYVPVGSLEAYKAKTNWSNYADQMVEE